LDFAEFLVTTKLRNENETKRNEKKRSEDFLLECKTLEENRKTQMVKLCEALEEAKGSRTKWAAYANHLGLHLM
jgi:hypothetical protein